MPLIEIHNLAPKMRNHGLLQRALVKATLAAKVKHLTDAAKVHVVVGSRPIGFLTATKPPLFQFVYIHERDRTHEDFQRLALFLSRAAYEVLSEHHGFVETVVGSVDKNGGHSRRFVCIYPSSK